MNQCKLNTHLLRLAQNLNLTTNMNTNRTQNNNNEQLFIKLTLESFASLNGSADNLKRFGVDINGDQTDNVSNLLNQSSYYKVVFLDDYNPSNLYWSLVNNKIVPIVSQFSNLFLRNLVNFPYLNFEQFSLVKNRSNSKFDLMLFNISYIGLIDEPFLLLPIDLLYLPILITI